MGYENAKIYEKLTHDPTKIGALLLTATWSYPPRHIGRWAWGTLLAWAGHNPVRASVWPPGAPGVGAAGTCSGQGHPGGWRLSALSLFERLGVVLRGLVLCAWFGFRGAESRQHPWVPWGLCAFPSAPPPGAPCVQPLRARVMASPSQQHPQGPAAKEPWRVCPSGHKQQPRPSAFQAPFPAPAGCAPNAFWLPTAYQPMVAALPTPFGCLPPARRWWLRRQRFLDAPRHANDTLCDTANDTVNDTANDTAKPFIYRGFLGVHDTANGTEYDTRYDTRCSTPYKEK